MFDVAAFSKNGSLAGGVVSFLAISNSSPIQFSIYFIQWLLFL